jgi:hypothetical protein
MGDLKFGNVTPSIGDIKVGSNDVSRIYQGTTELWPGCSPITPAETEINGLVWQNKNSVITARTNGGTIPIVTSSSAWNSAYNAGTPAAAYWNFNSSNSEIGLYYNIYCLNTIQPPTGFRIPTQSDVLNIANATTGTEISNNDCGFWPSEINSNPNLNTINWNSNGRGYIYVGWDDEVVFYNDYGRYPTSAYWYLPQPTQAGRTAFFATRYRDQFGPSIQNGLVESQSFDSKKDSGYHMRFVKDVPTSTVNFYYNDTQTGSADASLNNYGFMASTSSGLTVANQFANVSFEIIGGPATIKFVAYNDQGLANPPNARFTEIKWEIYDKAARSPITDLVHETIWSSSTSGSDPYPIRPTTPATTPQGQPGYKIENWGTDAGSVTLNPGVYYVEMKMTFGNEFAGASAGTNYIMSFET